MQFAENLTERQAPDVVRSRIDWKYALSLDLTDVGFDFSVLSEFRQRLLEHQAGERLLNTILEHYRQAGLLSSGGQQHTLEFRQRYGKRARVEGTISQCVFALDTCRSRYLCAGGSGDEPHPCRERAR